MLSILLTMVDDDNKPKIRYLYKTYHEDMIRFARAKLRQMNCREYYYDAEDVVQEAFLRIVKYIDHIHIRGDEKSLKAYLLTVVANRIAELSKEAHFEASEEVLAFTESEEDFFELLALRERVKAVSFAIEKLDERYKIVLFYHYRREMSVKEIAAVLEIPENTVKTRLARGRAGILKQLGEVGQDE